MDEQVDGEGGWWLCVRCGSYAAMTMVNGMCLFCGGTEMSFEPDGECK